LERVARIVLVAAAVVHAADIGLGCMHGAHPGMSVREAVSFLAFVTALASLVLGWRLLTGAVGALVVPATVVLVIAAKVTPQPALQEGPSLLGRMHVSLAVLGVALFAVAACASLLYILEARQLRAKRFGLLFRRGVPLEQLDKIVRRAIAIGFPVFTAAILLGAFYMARVGQSAIATPRHVFAMMAWFAFAALLLSRSLAGWHGRRPAVLAIVGFVTSLAVVVLYLLRAAFRG